MTKKYSALLISTMLASVSLAPLAYAQDDEPADMQQAIEQQRSQHPDLSVQSKTTTTYTGIKDAAPIVQTETKVKYPPRVPIQQGAAPIAPVDPANYPPKTDEASQLVYLTGGVGESEIAYFKSLKEDYTLKLLMADKEGHLVGDAIVTIADTKGQVIATLEGVGPYLLVKLPAGKYKITAALNDEEVVRTATVKAGKIAAVDVRF